MTRILGRDYRNEMFDLEYEEAFFGQCAGVALVKRGPADSHVCFIILVEDDEHWYVSSGNKTSSFWLSDLQAQLAEARTWMERNCNLDGAYGYKFRS